jgi:hypothetical protein
MIDRVSETSVVYRSLLRPILREAKRSVNRLGVWRQYRRHRKTYLTDLERSGSNDFPVGRAYPCLDDRWESSGTATGHYFHQDLLVAQRIFTSQPQRHVDVGSRVDGFVAHVASFREIEVLDIRPLDVRVSNITFRQFDLMTDDLAELGTADSVSCLHALEHFGLGRYGDKIDVNGWKAGLHALTRLTAVGGTLYLSVPIGVQRVEFDAHRVFSVPFLRKVLSDQFEIVAFNYVDDLGDLQSVSMEDLMKDSDSFGCSYGCGIFELRRRHS